MSIFALIQQSVYHITNEPAPVTVPVSKASLDYSDFVSIMLTGVSVILAVLALVIGVLALWGYSQFKDMTKKASQEHLETIIRTGNLNTVFEQVIGQYIEGQLRDGDLRNFIAERIDRVILTDAARRAEGSEEASDDEAPFNG